MDPLFLAVQSTYQGIELALYHGNFSDAQTFIDKKAATANLVSAIDRQLCAAGVTLDQLSFIAVNQGPAPFTTLRVVIATINGISFARNLPLVGVDGLRAFLAPYHDNVYTLALLNAFAGQLYFALKGPGTFLVGVDAASSVLAQVDALIGDHQVTVIGNGASLFQDAINQTFGIRAQINTPLEEFPPLSAIAASALKQWPMAQPVYRLLPLYLKQAL